MSLNLLAMDKSVLRLLRGPKGWKVVGCDINALEPHVVTHFSQCPTLMKLYGPNAVPNQDAYLLLGTAVPAYRDVFLEYYNPDAPTKEGVAYLKENHALERFVCKTAFLSCMYGISVPALQASLAVSDVHMPYREVEAVHRAYWKNHVAVKKFTQSLQQQWRNNGGYIITGRGTPKPMCHQDASKDMLSRFTQTTGHQYVMRWLWHINEVRQEEGLQAYPLIADLHDSTTWACPPEEVEETGYMIQEGLRRLNEELSLTVTLKGATKVGDTLSIIA